MRVEGRCVGDCAKCKLLENGEVDMLPCAVDQVFRRVQSMCTVVTELSVKVESLMNQEKRTFALAGGDDEDDGCPD